MEKEKLVELAKDVAEHRQAVELAKQVKASAEGLMAATAEGRNFQTSTIQLEAQQDFLSQAETTLKSAVLEVYKETEERKPITGTEVKIFKRMEYDPAEVLTWCRANAPSLLIVNKKPFEKTAVDMGAPVKVIETPKCTIATDLSAYLESATETVAVKSEGGK